MILTHFSGSTPISCGMRPVSTNAYFLGKDVLDMENYTVFWRQGDLINRLIHRSWGEGFVAIIYKTQEADLLWISLFFVCQMLFLGIEGG